MEWQQTLSLEFFRDVTRLPAAVATRVDRVVNKMHENPWSRELHPEKVHQAEQGVHSCRVDDNYRIIWKHIKPTDIVYCLVDKHDRAYQRAMRKSFTLAGGVLKIADIVEVGAKPVTANGALFSAMQPKEAQVGRLFIGYRDQELLDFGVPQDLLAHVRAMDDIHQMENLERLLSDEVYNRLLEIGLGMVERPVVQDEKLHESLVRNQGGDELARFVDSDEFKRALSGSMEDWMLFLTPAQRQLSLRRYNGPARLKGVAGSGKTVVALHRIRHLARTAHQDGKRVLFLTYGKSLPPIMKHLLEQLAGGNTPELQIVDCLTIHSWCSRFIRSCRGNTNVDRGKVEQALEKAFQQLREEQGKDFALSNQSVEFCAEEIRYMIKGRDIAALDDYLSLDRSGRGTPLQANQRRAVWAVYEAYQANLKGMGVCDFDDYILQALRFVEAGKLRVSYAAAVVDEIQDLTEATMKLIRAIVPSGPDDLFLVGDGLQRIYPGGYTLNRLNIDISGRGTLLRKNYRNTQQILQAAHAMIQDLSFNDLDEEDSRTLIPEYSVRQGAVPVLKDFPFAEKEIDWVVTEIGRLKKECGYRDRDFAIIYRQRHPYQAVIESRLAGKCGLSELDKQAESYFGPGVKQTTFHNVKGLEFKVVFVVGVTDGFLVPKDNWDLEGEALQDYMDREQRLLYVAMTRARDVLYLTYARGQASRFLNSVPDDLIARG